MTGLDHEAGECCDQPATADDIAEIIREESAGIQLTRAATLRGHFPDSDIDSLLQAASLELTDIASISGASGGYYYSNRFITATYAQHLVRVADANPLQLVAATVRDDSCNYTRPTALSSFLAAPFNLSSADLQTLCSCLGQDRGVEDIQSCQASNGAVYLFSVRFLTAEHARALAEFYEVEVWQNP